MEPNWLGPYRIHEVLNKGTFRLSQLKDGKVLAQLYNMKRLKLYYQSDSQPSASAQSDSQPSASAQSDSQPSASTQSDSQPSASAQSDSQPSASAQSDSQSSILPTSCQCRRQCNAKKSCSCIQTNKWFSEESHLGHSCTNCDEDSDVIDLLTYVSEAKRQCLSQPWVNVGGITLHEEDRNILSSGGWLNDNHITAYQNLLHQQYPAVRGLQSAVLAQSFAMEPQAGEFVQVLNESLDHHFHHWMSSSFSEGL